MRCLPCSIFFLQWANLVGPSLKKTETMEVAKFEDFFLKLSFPPHWPTYIGERRTTIAKACGIKVRCYWELFEEHVSNLGSHWCGLGWTNSHQCTNWLFYSLDGLCFFIQRQMGFITIHFFLLLNIVFFLFWFLVVCPINLTSHIATLLTFLPS